MAKEIGGGIEAVIGGKSGSQLREHGRSGIFHDERIAYFEGNKVSLLIISLRLCADHLPTPWT